MWLFSLSKYLFKIGLQTVNDSKLSISLRDSIGQNSRSQKLHDYEFCKMAYTKARRLARKWRISYLQLSQSLLKFSNIRPKIENAMTSWVLTSHHQHLMLIRTRRITCILMSAGPQQHYAMPQNKLISSYINTNSS